MNKDGHISCEEIGSVLMSLGEDLPGYKIRELINEVDKDANGMVEFNEFLEASKMAKSIWGNNVDKYKGASDFTT